MPSVPNRSELERKYGKVMAGILRRQMGELLELMGDPPDLSKVPPDFWARHGKEAEAKLRPFGEKVYLEAAERMLAEVPVGVDWALVNEAAMTWADEYTYNLVTGINSTSQRVLQRSVSQYFQEAMTQGELRKRLSGTFGPVRAEMIARTEVTRAAVEGERATVKEADDILSQHGVAPMVPFWQTRNDEIVCPICGPKHNKEIKDDEYPPAHPRCRCWITYKIPKMKKR